MDPLTIKKVETDAESNHKTMSHSGHEDLVLGDDNIMPGKSTSSADNEDHFQPDEDNAFGSTSANDVVTEVAPKTDKKSHKQLEKVRRAIQNVLHISRLKSELLGGLVSFPFESRSEWTYYSSLQVSLANIAPGCLSCFVLTNDEKPKSVLFSVREPDWLLLFMRMSGNAGFATVFMAFPVHCIEGVANKQDPRIIELSIRSAVCPHQCCILLPNQKEKWQLTLFFESFSPDKGNVNELKNSNVSIDNCEDALRALDYIESNRKRVRRRVMNEIGRILAPDEVQSQSNALQS
ncbi:hypothetical protein RFI_01487 [Reticulomyxa filosa]|uniref:Uncharacterized protein n=1 Tax=Reticulomyxa filosa TaxID=46433 RepID=X6PBT3_RETFI|nr:hypothetical protein RFI_01487 [Reticulomyxa filosa]|eukprot:ETO35578.1 hypothetical protein RFI_01487 [Reticulomyxa filosa]